MGRAMDVVELGLILPFFGLQILMLLFLLQSRRLSASTAYKTPFYNLFIFVTFVDVAVVVDNFVGIQLPKFASPDLVQWYLESPTFTRICYFFSGATVCLQCFLHLFIVVNRFWVMSTILRARELPRKLLKLARCSVWILPGVCVLLVLRRAFGSAVHYTTPEGVVSVKYLEASVQEYQATVAALVLIFTGSTSFVFQILTLMKCRNIRKSGISINKKMNRDFEIVFQALIMLVLHVLLAVCEICIYIGAKFGVPSLLQTGLFYFVYFDDAFCLVGSLVLLIVSKYVRHDFLAFYLPWCGALKKLNNSTSNAKNVAVTVM